MLCCRLFLRAAGWGVLTVCAATVIFFMSLFCRRITRS
jgi:hypothetical protein